MRCPRQRTARVLGASFTCDVERINAVTSGLKSTGDVVSLINQLVPIGLMGMSAVLGEMSGRIAPVGASVDPGGSGGFVPPMAFGGLLDLSAEGIPAGVSNVPVWPGGETRSEEPSGNAALAGGSDRVASEGVFDVAGSAGVSDSTCSRHSI